jgi:hypothetical protein
MLRRSLCCLALAVASFVPALSIAQPPNPPPNMPASPLFPADNWWNLDVSGVTADVTQTTKFHAFVGAGRPLHPDFGGDVDPDDPTNPEIYGMVYFTVPGSQPRVPVFFPDPDYDSESDHGWPGLPSGYPIPDAARTQKHWIEGGARGDAPPGGDRHMIIVDTDNRVLYELWHARYNTTLNRWEGSDDDDAGSGAIFSLESNFRRPEGWTSADAAGLAILPGLIRRDEAMSGQPIRHAFRFTMDDSNGHVWPASHDAGSNVNAMPFGTRLRLKPGTVITGFPAYIQRIFQAMKTYGLIFADNGSDMYIQGAYDANWNNDELNPAFGALHASDFEVLPLGWKPVVPALGAATSFYTLTPCRMLDTRLAAGPAGGPLLTANVARTVKLNASCGVPTTAKSLSINVTVVNTPGTGFLRVYPGHMETPPNVSMVSFRAGTTRADNVVVALSTVPGMGTLELLSSLSGVHVLIDVNGYFE